LALAVAVVLPALARVSNCGGNTRALHDCRTFVLVLRIWDVDHNGANFQYSETDSETREWLRLLGRKLGSARLLAKLQGVRFDPKGTKSVIMVCDTPFDNVPQRRFRRAPFAHAVAYSTGEVGLLSPTEFQRMDLSEFTDLATIASDRVEPEGAANRSQPVQPGTNSTPLPAGSGR
jgi:hypothetical protein